MLLVLIYWLYLSVLTCSYGMFLKNILNLKVTSLIFIPLFGSFFITIIASVVAVFYNLNGVFESLLFLIAIVFLVMFKSECISYLKQVKSEFNKLSKFLKFLFLIVLFLAVAQSASSPYLIDNESYYIQSVKWLDNYGIVPGLGNLHIFLSQLSPWHIFQSATNLNFLYDNFNDLSGYYLVLGNAYAFSHLNRYFKTREYTDLLIGIFPVSNVFLFQFIGAPSPDIAIYICFLILSSEFIKNFYFKDQLAIVNLFIIAFFAIYIKLTAILFVVLPIIILIKLSVNKIIKRNEYYKITALGLIISSLFVIKNGIITGYLLFPITSIGELDVDWKLVVEISNFLNEQNRLNTFLLSDSEYNNMSHYRLFLQWLTLPKLDGVFNLGMTILLVVIPFVIYKSKNKTLLIIFYAVSLLQLAWLLNISPQYRFFLMYFLLLLSVFITHFITNTKIIKLGVTISVLIITIPLFLSVHVNQLTDNKFHLKPSTFSIDYLVVPHKITRYPFLDFSSFKEGNTTFHSPNDLDFFWGTGDGPLPTLQKGQFNYFKTYFKVIPQVRSTNLKDGFISKPINND